MSSQADSLHGPLCALGKQGKCSSFSGNHLLLKAATHVGLSSHPTSRTESWVQCWARAWFQVQDQQDLVKRHVVHIALSTVALVSSYAPC